MYCILAYLALVLGQFLVPQEVRIFVGLAALVASMAAAVFVWMLALSVYNTGTAIVLGVLTLIPLVGLIVLLIINGKATNILRAHGLKVGLLGTDPSQLPPRGQGPL